MTTFYPASWSRLLVVLSGASSLLCGIVAYRERFALLSGHWRHVDFWLAFLPLVLLVGCALFMVRGYSVDSETLWVHRLLWKTRLPLKGLESAAFEPGLLRRSLRTFGNGGFFSFTGWYYQRAVGSYRAYATDSHRTVLLRIQGKGVVLTPNDPEALVQQVRMGISKR